jgi:anti-sigma regulatory factor (Ser/Thr protein kinase)
MVKLDTKGSAQRMSTSLEAWPRSSTLTLAALPTAPACARLHATAVLYEWGMEPLAENAKLIISELTTNAIMAATDPEARLGNARQSSGVPLIRLKLLSDYNRVLIEVWDPNPLPPVVEQPELEDESGRGLMLVGALSESWGWDVPKGWCGKAVWVELRAG